MNILGAEEKKDGVEFSLDPDPKMAREPAEVGLFEALDRTEAALGPALEREDFRSAMSTLADLRAPIDAFFDDVQVNDDNPMVRRNRLCLLQSHQGVMQRVAVFSSLEGKGLSRRRQAALHPQHGRARRSFTLGECGSFAVRRQGGASGAADRRRRRDAPGVAFADDVVETGLRAAIADLEAQAGRRMGDGDDPLLIALRSSRSIRRRRRRRPS